MDIKPSRQIAASLILLLILTSKLLAQPANPGILGEPLPIDEIDIDVGTKDRVSLQHTCDCVSTHLDAGFEPNGMIVRQYNAPRYMKPLLDNPGRGVTGIHVLSYDPVNAKFPEFPLADTIARIRSKGLRPYPGFRIGGMSFDDDNNMITPLVQDPSKNCDQTQHWETMDTWLQKILEMMEEDEMIVFDGEYYVPGGLECRAPTYDENTVALAMSEFLTTLRESGRRVGYYPASPGDLIMENIFENAPVGSEAWVESSFEQPWLYASNLTNFVSTQHVTQRYTEKLQTQFPQLNVRQGLYDDVLRDWGTLYYKSESFPARSWVFDANRADREHWGTDIWEEGRCLVDSTEDSEIGTLLDSLQYVWPLWQGNSSASVFPITSTNDARIWRNYMPNLTIPNPDHGVSGALFKYHTAAGLWGFSDDLVPINPISRGYRPGGENYLQVDSVQHKFLGEQTFKITFELNEEDFIRVDPTAIMSLWLGPDYTDGQAFSSTNESRRTFNLALRDKKLVLQMSLNSEDHRPLVQNESRYETDSAEVVVNLRPQWIVIDEMPTAGETVSLVFGYRNNEEGLGVVNYAYSKTGDFVTKELNGPIYTGFGKTLEVGRISTKQNYSADWIGNTLLVGQIINWNTMLGKDAMLGSNHSVGALTSDYPFGNYRGWETQKSQNDNVAATAAVFCPEVNHDP